MQAGLEVGLQRGTCQHRFAFIGMHVLSRQASSEMVIVGASQCDSGKTISSSKYIDNIKTLFAKIWLIMSGMYSRLQTKVDLFLSKCHFDFKKMFRNIHCGIFC